MSETFHPMRRKDRELSTDEARQLLALAKWGVLSFVPADNGYPHAVPINCAYVDGALLFHCAHEGTKLDLLARDDRACFSAVLSERIYKEHYSTHFESVICYGRVECLPAAKVADALTRFTARLFDTEPTEAIRAKAASTANATTMLKLHIDHITAKRCGPESSLHQG